MGTGTGAGAGNGTGGGKGAGAGMSAPPHAHLQFLQFHLHFNFSIKFPRRGDTLKHTWHLQGFGMIAGFTIDRLFTHLFSIGLKTVGITVLHIFTGAAMTGGNGFGLTSTDLHWHKSGVGGGGTQSQKHAAPFIWKKKREEDEYFTGIPLFIRYSQAITMLNGSSHH